MIVSFFVKLVLLFQIELGLGLRTGHAKRFTTNLLSWGPAIKVGKYSFSYGDEDKVIYEIF